ncbi:3-oxoacyl-ACP reductase, partial [Cellulomonas hominis]|nr:3-oxoacyl-ACP reductase [Cellulomonas hominis]
MATTDRYLDLVNDGVTAKIAKQLGLPRPARLHRYRPGAPLVDGPVLVLGDGADADTLAQFLSGTSPEHKGWDLDVRRHASEGTRFAAVVLALTEVTHPDGLAGPLLALAPVLKTLAPQGRVVTVSRPATDDQAPALAAARQGVDGALRSVAKEMRAGGTANGVVVADDVP